MRYLLVGIGLLSVSLLGLAMNPTRSLQDSDSAYEAAYQKWSDAIDSHQELGDTFWVRTDIGPDEMRKATGALLSFGPNLTPFLVKHLRTETDPMRLYRLVRLLSAVSGINLYYQSGAENIYDASPRFRDQFIQDWDSQKYSNATQVLETLYPDDEDVSAQRVDPKKIAQVRRFGVYAIPFITERIKSRNSRELFAAFLIITGNSDQYAQYIENASGSFTGRDHKLSLMKSWARDNEKKLDKLQSLHDRVKELANDPD
jgi:hypothetical protein